MNALPMKVATCPVWILVCGVLCGSSLISSASAKQRNHRVEDTWLEFTLRVVAATHEGPDVPVEASIVVRSLTGQAVSGVIDVTSDRWDKPACSLVVHDSFPLRAHTCVFKVNLNPSLTLGQVVVARFTPSEPSRFRSSMRLADLASGGQ